MASAADLPRWSFHGMRIWRCYPQSRFLRHQLHPSDQLGCSESWRITHTHQSNTNLTHTHTNLTHTGVCCSYGFPYGESAGGARVAFPPPPPPTPQERGEHPFLCLVTHQSSCHFNLCATSCFSGVSFWAGILPPRRSGEKKLPFQSFLLLR